MTESSTVGKRRVAITGLGLVSPGGGQPREVFDGLLRGESGIRLHSGDEGPQPVVLPAGLCRDFDAVALLGRPRAGIMDRHCQLGIVAAEGAWRDAGLSLPEAGADAAAPDGEARADWGVAWGTAVGSVITYERGYRDLFLAGRKRVAPLSLVLGLNNATASQAAIRFGLGGPCLTWSVACASSAIAIGEAARHIREGRATLMLAGGSDAPLAYAVVRAWEALHVLAPGDAATAAQACRPFQLDRAGLVLAEGAGALVLEDWEHAVRRGAHIHAELAGYGSTCDHSHLVRPDPAGQVRALRQALDDAGLRPADVGYVNAHGTATREGDPAEVAALREVFGAAAREVAVSSTKSAHGHLMGASGAVEAIIAVLALRSGSVPPTLGSAGNLDPACDGVDHVWGEARHGLRLRAALSNSFAFGGSNAVLAFRPPVEGADAKR